jgi:uncharacterized protein
MPEYLAPGVYVEEIPSSNKPIQGGSTSTAGMVGMTARGPVGTPTLVSSWGAFTKTFGGYLNPLVFTGGKDALPYAVEGFFDNQGARVFVVRVVGDGATESELTLYAATDGGYSSTLGAAAAVGDATFSVTDGGAADGTDLLVIDGENSEAVSVQAVAGTDVTAAAPLAANHPAGAQVVQVTPVLAVHARDVGSWGDSLRITAAPSAMLRTELAEGAGAGDLTITLKTAFGLYPGSVVLVDGAEVCEVAAVDTGTGVVTLSDPLAGAAAAGDPVVSVEFSLTVERVEGDRAVESEVFDRLSLVPTHPRYAPTVVGSWDSATDLPSATGGSALIRLEDVVAVAADRTLPMVTGVPRFLAGGDDDADDVDESSYVGNPAEDPGQRTGIQALQNEPSISLVAVPGQTSLPVQKTLVEHCELMRYRFAVLDTPLGATMQAARTHRQNFDSTRAAIYYPGLEISDPFGAPGERRQITPSGHLLGLYARTDLTRGVHKAPANEVVRGVLSFDQKLDKAAQDILNPLNLNCLRDFRTESRGLRVYGGRVATSDPEWKYVNVRRLFLFMEQSLDTGLQWAVFEPNSEPLWKTVKQSVTGFLNTVWRSGALAGTTQEEAFFVNVGYGVTMTEDDVQNGRLIVEIGAAPVYPAEFVIVRISQKTREATS